MLIDCNGALLSLFPVFEGSSSAHDVCLHLDFVSNSHNGNFWTERIFGFGLNVLSVISATITWRFLISVCFWGMIHRQWGQVVSMGSPWPWEWFGALGSAV